MEKPVNKNQWQDRRDNSKRKRRPENDGNGGKLLKKQNSYFKDSEALRGEQPIPPVQQAATFPSYNYSSTDHLFVDNSRHALSMMSYNMMATVNTPWAVNSFDGMALNQHNVTQMQFTVLHFFEKYEDILS